MKKGLFLVWIILAALVLFVVWRIIQPAATPATSTTGQLTLENLPAQACPRQAAVLVTKINSLTVLTDRLVTVRTCQTIDLTDFLPGRQETYQIYIKVRGALAFKLAYDSSSPHSLVYALQFGDVNSDNVIDETDAAAVKSALFAAVTAANTTDIQSADLDGDGQVTVADLALVRLNQGVGVTKPNNEPWPRLVN